MHSCVHACEELLGKLTHALPLGACLFPQDLKGHLSAQPQTLHHEPYGHADRATLLQRYGELGFAQPRSDRKSVV